MPGPPPLPTNLKLFRGNPGKRALNHFEPQPDSRIPPCPKVVQGEARKEWHRMARELHRIGLLTVVDRAALTAYCLLWERFIDSEQKVREKGTIIRGVDGGPVLNPYLRVASKT